MEVALNNFERLFLFTNCIRPSNREMEMMNVETFGPIIPIQKIKTLEEAIELITTLNMVWVAIFIQTIWKKH